MTRKDITFFLLLLCSVGFFSPFGIVSQSISFFSFYGISILILIKYSRKRIYCNKRISRLYCFLALGFGLALMSSWLVNEQDLIWQFRTALHYYFAYFAFFVLLKLSISCQKVEYCVYVFAVIAVCCYAINLLVYPNIIFGGGNSYSLDDSRGFIRMEMKCIHYMVLSFFMLISRLKMEFDRILILKIVLFAVFIVLSLTRQVIVCSFILGLLLLIQNMNIVKKIIVVGFAALILSFMVASIPVFNSMIELSQNQIELNSQYENIRLRAMNFYMFEAQSGLITSIVGNGIPDDEHSFWGRTFKFRERSRFVFPTDVGWCSFSFYFGLFTTLVLWIIIWKSILVEKPKRYQYLSYWLVYVFICGFVSGPQIYFDQVFNISVVLYMVWHSQSELNYKTGEGNA